MFKQQHRKCAICEKKINEKTANIDHSHITGTVRGLLCRNCNFDLGHYERMVGYSNIVMKYLNKDKYKIKYGGTTNTKTKYRKQILKEQDHKCAICGCKLQLNKVNLDHDHDTGLIRGVLCHACNTSLPSYLKMLKYKDKIEKYLQKGNHYNIKEFEVEDEN